MQTTFLKQTFESQFKVLLNKGNYLSGEWEFSVQYLGLSHVESGRTVPVGISVELNRDVKFAVLFNLSDFSYREELTVVPLHGMWFCLKEKSLENYSVSFVDLKSGQSLSLPSQSEVILQIAFRRVK